MKKYIILLLIISLASCKPKQIIHDHYITEIDSTAVLALKEVISHQRKEINQLKTTTKRLIDKNTTLINETQQHEINYDTGGTIMDNGKYPVSSEIITITKSKLEKTIKEQENIIQEYKEEINSVTQINRNLEYTVESLRNEIKELKSKSIPSFNLSSFAYGLVAGIILLIIIIVFLR